MCDTTSLSQPLLLNGLVTLYTIVTNATIMWDITYFLFDPTKLSSNWNFVNLTPQNQETGKKMFTSFY